MAARGRVVVLHFVGQMPLAGIAWQAVALSRRPRAARLRGVVRRGPRRQSLRSPRQQRVDGLRLQRRLSRAASWSAAGLAGRWAYWDAINDVYHGLSRASRSRALYRDADALFNLCGAARLRDEHMALPGAGDDRHRSGLRADQICRGRPRRPRLSRRAHAFLHLWRECRRRRAGSCRCAASRGSRRGRRWCSTCGPQAAGEGDCFTTIATWENKGKNIAFGGETYVVVEARQFPALPRPAAARAANASRWRCCRRRAEVEREVAAAWLAPRRPAADLGRHDRLWRFHPRLARRVHRRQGHLCPAAKRLVQRPQRLLPRLGPPGRHHAHRLEPLLSRGRRAVRAMATDGGARPPSRRSPPITRAMAAPPARWRRNISPATAFSRRCWRGAGYERSRDDRDGARTRRSLAGCAAPRPGTGWRLALFVVAALLVLATFDDYGITWDEDVAQLVRRLRPRLLPVALPRSARAHLARSHQLRRRLRHDRGGGRTWCRRSAPTRRGICSTGWSASSGSSARGGSAACWAARARGFLAALFLAAHAQLLRPDVQQPEGHPLRGRHGLVALLPGAAAAGAAAPGGSARWRSSALPPA